MYIMVYALRCSIPFTYQLHLLGTESWRQSVSPLPPHIITSRKHKLMCLSINMGSEKASPALYTIARIEQHNIKCQNDAYDYKREKFSTVLTHTVIDKYMASPGLQELNLWCLSIKALFKVM